MLKIFEAFLERTKGSKVIFAQDARWGLATANLGLAALSEGDERAQYLNAAASETQALVGVAEGVDPNKAAIGNARLELIELLRTTPVSIYEAANLPDAARYQPDPREAAMSSSPTMPTDTSGLGQGRPMTQEELEQFMRGPNEAGPETGPQPPAPGTDGDAATGEDGSGDAPEDPASGDGSSEDPAGSDDPATEDPAQPGQ